FNFANKDVLGSTIAVVPYIEPLIGVRNRLYGSIKAQLGLAYLSQLYDAEENPSNLFFSFPMSFFLGIEGNLYYKLDPYWQLVASANYNHISNGGIQEPNKGMNFPTFSVGAMKSFTSFSYPNYPKQGFNKSQRQTQVTVSAVLSSKNTPEEDGFSSELRPIYGAAIQWRYQLGALSHLKLGTEALFNGHTQTMAERRGESGNYWELAALAGHELVVGKIGFSQQLGIYLHKDFRETDLLYQRYGLSYRLSERLKMAGTLKAHRHIADILDFRLGYIF
ncbi:MAG: acyloxyacyl hydrolase, partial [Bacteroidota bacterium]